MSITTRIFLSILLSSTAGCVTVKLGSQDGKRASGVSVREPGSPFVSYSKAEVDAAWINPKNGNVISYVSDCQDPTDPPLEQVTAGVLSGLSDLKIEAEETVSVQGREGRRMRATGRVDGVPSDIDLLAFKRNHCIYILTYLGVKKSFAEGHPAFKAFVEGFRAP